MPVILGSAHRVTLEPSAGAIDVFTLKGGWVVSLVSSSDYLSSEPRKETGELTEWYRFERAGRFRFSVSLNSVWRVNAADEGGGKQHLDVKSNAVEFEVLPRDPIWEQQQLESLLHEIDAADSSAPAWEALYRLELLQTPAALSEEVRRYLAAKPAEYTPYYTMLIWSLRPEEVVPQLEAALRNPCIVPPSGFPDLLATLQVRRRMGIISRDPADPARQKADHLYREYFARYTAESLATVRVYSGSQRLNAEFEVWSKTEAQYGGVQPAPENLMQLRTEMLMVSSELSSEQQAEFVTMEWDKLPHSDLLPLIRRIAASARDASSQDFAYKFWCKDWPYECTQGIVDELQRPKSQTAIETIFLAREGEHPELDSKLAHTLSDVNVMRTTEGAKAAAAILCLGSINLRLPVTAFLDRLPPSHFVHEGVEGYLLGYLFRIRDSSAAKRLQLALQDRDAYRAVSVLRSLNKAVSIQGALPVVTAALRTANAGTTASAALFLSQHGSEDARDAIWQRLNALHDEWKDHANELRSAFGFTGAAAETARLEQALVCALVHGKTWKLTASDTESLEQSCLTDECREVARGRRSFSL